MSVVEDQMAEILMANMCSVRASLRSKYVAIDDGLPLASWVAAIDQAFCHYPIGPSRAAASSTTADADALMNAMCAMRTSLQARGVAITQGTTLADWPAAIDAVRCYLLQTSFDEYPAGTALTGTTPKIGNVWKAVSGYESLIYASPPSATVAADYACQNAVDLGVSDFVLRWTLDNVAGVSSSSYFLLSCRGNATDPSKVTIAFLPAGSNYWCPGLSGAMLVVYENSFGDLSTLRPCSVEALGGDYVFTLQGANWTLVTPNSTFTGTTNVATGTVLTVMAAADMAFNLTNLSAEPL